MSYLIFNKIVVTRRTAETLKSILLATLILVAFVGAGILEGKYLTIINQ